MQAFDLGKLVATPAALQALEEAGLMPIDLLNRHVKGDWGDMDTADKSSNDDAIQNGSRIFSAYRLSTDVKLWVITEAVNDAGVRASTCILLSDEY